MKRNEVIKQWLDKNQTEHSGFLKKAIRRNKYKYYYDLLFWVKLKYILIVKGLIK